MKILQVRFRNLNSLVGEWEVDFTHPDFESNGIFAITGPTGAGKSTILDAMCLALYGMTPRLNAITKSSNQIMSRQTGECFAEVTFKTGKGHFRCHWSQRRAYRKADGELQTQRHEISDAETSHIIDSSIRGVPQQVEEVTGMDFDRFTRSMLLAQGGFAVFLQANASERAPILEQITGTKIYSDISIQVHERTSAEKDRLKLMQVEIDGMPIISAEEEQELLLGKQQKEQEATALHAQLEQKKTALAWLEGLSRLQQEWEGAKQDQALIQAESEAFAPQRQRLQRANKALGLAPDFTGLAAIRKEQKEDQAALNQCQSDRPASEAAMLAAQDSLKAAQDSLLSKKTSQAEMLPVIRAVSILDTNIAARRNEQQAADARLAQAEAELAGQQQKQQNDLAALEKLSKQMDELRVRLEATAGDARLTEQLAGIRERISAIKALAASVTAKNTEATDAETKRKALQATLDSSRSQLASAQKAFEQAQADMSQEQAELAAVLNGKDLPAWIELQSQAKAELDTVTTALSAWAEKQQLEQSRGELKQKDTELRHEQATATGQQQKLQEEIQAQEKVVEDKRVDLARLERIRSLGDERQKLQDGLPCPLCGATNHPYAVGNIPVADDAEKQFSEARQRQRQLESDCNEVTNRLAIIARDLVRLTTENTALGEKLKATADKISSSCTSLGLTAEAIADADLEHALRQLESEKKALHEQAKLTATKAARLQGKHSQAQTRVAQARDDVAKHDKATQAVNNDLDTTLAALTRLQGEAAANQTSCDQAMTTLQGELAEYNVTAPDLVSLDAAYKTLEQRQKQRVADSNQIVALEKKHVELTSQTSIRADQISKQENSLAELQRQREQVQQNLKALLDERQETFADRIPAQEEKRLADEVTAAEQVMENARTTVDDAQKRLHELETKAKELSQAIALRQADLDLANAGFAVRLTESGFIDEQDFLAARLPEPERGQLADQASQLSDRIAAAAALEREKSEQLAAEQQKNITSESNEELTAIIQDLQEKHQGMMQEFGAIQQKLKENDERRQLLQEKIDGLNRQQAEYARWENLNQLIGSHDGKKYRNFAQGLTFDIMIRHANVQLQKLTDRYLLIRSEDALLELNVIDNYQAGDIRSTKNLSGGESFIVSLALALGLAQMASRNIRVDSLFLDEGFGTLDEDALDTALETLANLQHDGKLIGVISHVSAIKDRINTQIKVTPKSGGKSIISGPGCRGGGKLNAEC
ncbi:MAG: Nuclease SbcCD subunit C [Lentisphaerae bacterium ADurb.Bin082]|nr:MAG: Nuclease SbcCD subunit C [Lentisphaerae bacterium ADurb.Bin082]